MSERMDDLRDQLAVVDLARRERLARDAQDWDTLRNSYHPESRVFISWFDGTGAEFAEASRRMVESGGGSVHHLGPTIVTLAGDRAIADTSCAILMRRQFEGVECDVTAYCRHRSRVERMDGTWRLWTLIGIYQKDVLVPTNPAVVPRLDTAKLASFRESYKHMSYYRAQLGHEPNMDRVGIDRPSQLEELLHDDREWLDKGQ